MGLLEQYKNLTPQQREKLHNHLKEKNKNISREKLTWSKDGYIKITLDKKGKIIKREILEGI